MKLIDLFEQQIVIEGSIIIPQRTITLVGYEHQGKPIAQAKVLGDFYCSRTQIKSLEGGPSWIGGYFNCTSTRITSLKGGPSYVGKSFECSNTLIESLEGGPRHVGGMFSCVHTGIESLQGAPSWVGGNFICWNTKIKSLHNIHKQIKHIDDTLFMSSLVKSHILGVMFITGLKSISYTADATKSQKQAAVIINKHLAGDRNIHLAQEELIEGGLSEFAKL